MARRTTTAPNYASEINAGLNAFLMNEIRSLPPMLASTRVFKSHTNTYAWTRASQPPPPPPSPPSAQPVPTSTTTSTATATATAQSTSGSSSSSQGTDVLSQTSNSSSMNFDNKFPMTSPASMPPSFSPAFSTSPSENVANSPLYATGSMPPPPPPSLRPLQHQYQPSLHHNVKPRIRRPRTKYSNAPIQLPHLDPAFSIPSLINSNSTSHQIESTSDDTPNTHVPPTSTEPSFSFPQPTSSFSFTSIGNFTTHRSTTFDAFNLNAMISQTVNGTPYPRPLSAQPSPSHPLPPVLAPVPIPSAASPSQSPSSPELDIRTLLAWHPSYIGSPPTIDPKIPLRIIQKLTNAIILSYKIKWDAITSLEFRNGGPIVDALGRVSAWVVYFVGRGAGKVKERVGFNKMLHVRHCMDKHTVEFHPPSAS
ncbi:hypothetical protein BDN70DRAFT_894781 [Pholiota conissans]|uniref:Uncharacterized protein n=1 Tax=Pholiota conissans TaxID=109636 RepID=A0A9P6D0W3_9AGAR|nr:hypothetical protein BDN70DRAFT_894781 [Pholiota conissans]